MVIDTEYTRLGISPRILEQIVPLPAPDGPEITINKPRSAILTPKLLQYLHRLRVAQYDVPPFQVE